MHKAQICQIFDEYGISTECVGSNEDRSWSDVIHYPLMREVDLTDDQGSELLAFIWYMRALCIKNAVFYVPMIMEHGKERYYHFLDDEQKSIPVFSTRGDIDSFLRVHDMPSCVYYKEKELMELIEGLHDDVELLINPLTECKPVKIFYYTNCLRLAKNITEDRIKEILEKRKAERGLS